MANDYGDQIKYKESPYNISSDKVVTASGVRTALGTKEDVANKQDTITDNSTYYPSAKAVYAHTSRVDNPHSVTAGQIGARLSTWVPTKSDVGLGNVNDTSDINKPVSTLTQNALNNKQDTITWATSISASSTHYEYPTAQAVYELVQREL
ncbi:phage tail fiber protein [Candidatus Termititenax persephonae]|uniref:Phage tail fiber protein n=1 Tax=Candidatus Termititenax persephonae TaxID=2218525 RepID=A0A388TEZ2_9BACT|nr:phage tail fiber protein [Candidatus Termititenax persephonae]